MHEDAPEDAPHHPRARAASWAHLLLLLRLLLLIHRPLLLASSAAGSTATAGAGAARSAVQVRRARHEAVAPARAGGC